MLNGAKFFKFWSFLQPQSVNNFYKLSMGDFVPDPLPRLYSWTPLGTSVCQTPWAIAPKWKLLRPPLVVHEQKNARRSELFNREVFNRPTNHAVAATSTGRNYYAPKWIRTGMHPIYRNYKVQQNGFWYRRFIKDCHNSYHFVLYVAQIQVHAGSELD